MTVARNRHGLHLSVGMLYARNMERPNRETVSDSETWKSLISSWVDNLDQRFISIESSLSRPTIHIYLIKAMNVLALYSSSSAKAANKMSSNKISQWRFASIHTSGRYKTRQGRIWLPMGKTGSKDLCFSPLKSPLLARSLTTPINLAIKSRVPFQIG